MSQLFRPEVAPLGNERYGKLFFGKNRFGRTTNFREYSELSKAQGQMKYLENLLAQDDYRFDKSKRDSIMARLQPLKEAVNLDQAAKVLQEEEEFSKWLVGRGKEEDHMKTPWYRCPLTHLPSVREYIKTKMDMRKEFMKQLSEMEIRQPDNVMDAWNYYKFIVNGNKDNLLGYLEDWSVTLMDKQQIEMDLGRELMEKIINQPNYSLCMPDDDLQVLATDFRAYMDLHMELDTKEKYKQTKLMELRKQMMERVSQYRHHDDIKRVWRQFLDQQMDYTEAVIFDLNALEELERKRRSVEENWKYVVRTRPDLVIQPEVKELFRNVLDDIKQRKKASYETLKKEVEDMMIDPKKLPKLVKNMQMRKLRRQIPDELVAFAYGYDVDSDQIKKILNGDYTDKWIAVMNECDELVMDLQNPALIAALVESVDSGAYGFYMPSEYPNFLSEVDPLVDRLIKVLLDFEAQSSDPNSVEQTPATAPPPHTSDANRNEPGGSLQQQAQILQSLGGKDDEMEVDNNEDEEEDELTEKRRRKR
jgi:hypothetical protein